MEPDREFRLPRITRRIRIWSSAALLFTPLAVFGSPAHAADEWTTMNKDYSAQRYVDLDEITKENVGGLKEVCEIELNQPVVFSSGLLMVGGALYVLTNRQTVAFDAATCALRWRHLLDFKGPPVGAGGRGLGYLDGKVFRGAPDGRVMAFDANTGKVLPPPIIEGDLHANRWPSRLVAKAEEKRLIRRIHPALATGAGRAMGESW